MSTETALAEFNDFEFIVDGRADYPEIVFDGIVESLVVVPLGLPSGPLSLGPVNTVAVIADDVNGGITSGGDGFVAALITPGVFVSAFNPDARIGLFGPNTHLLLNAGFIDMDVAFGKGDDAMFNFGDVFGDVRMGGGDDFFINDTFQAGPLDLFGFVLGSVSMGSGDDVVLNGGSLGNVALGSGDDFYAAITPQSLLDNFDNPLVFASEIRAGSGSDTVYGGANDDVIFGQSGSDVLNGHNGNDRISGGNGKDTIRGGNGDDTLNGGAGKDELLGGNGDDTLLGGNGQDTLIGGRGDDEMSGGSGADTFILRSSISYGNIGNDTITDLRDGDSIVLYPNFFTLGVDGKVPTISDELILSNITYGDGGTAVLDLHALFEVTGFAPLKNSSVTFENVNEGDIDADNFYTATDFLIDNPEVFIL